MTPESTATEAPKRKSSERRQRTELVGLRLTSAELEQLRGLAGKQSIAEYVRQRMLSGEFVVEAEYRIPLGSIQADHAKFLAERGKAEGVVWRTVVRGPWRPYTPLNAASGPR